MVCSLHLPDAARQAKVLFDLLVCADELGILSTLLTFVAAVLDRIHSPNQKTWTCLLARRVAKLEETVTSHSCTLIDVFDSSMKPAGPSSSDSGIMLWSSLPLTTDPVGDGWVQVVRKNAPVASALPSDVDQPGHTRQARRRRLNGKRDLSLTSTVKAVSTTVACIC